MSRVKYIETVIFNGIEARVKNLIERGLFPLLEFQKESFIADSKDAINKDIQSTIISLGYVSPFNPLENESECIERHTNRLVKHISNLGTNKYTTELKDLIRAIAKDISNLYADV